MRRFKTGISKIHNSMMNNHAIKVELKIATLKLCLGLKNKRIEVEKLLVANNIKILCLQEVKVEINLDPKLLSLKNFQFELETNSVKSRTGIFIANEIPYRRMLYLEGNDSHIVIIDI